MSPGSVVVVVVVVGSVLVVVVVLVGARAVVVVVLVGAREVVVVVMVLEVPRVLVVVCSSCEGTVVTVVAGRAVDGVTGTRLVLVVGRGPGFTVVVLVVSSAGARGTDWTGGGLTATYVAAAAQNTAASTTVERLTPRRLMPVPVPSTRLARSPR